VRLTTAAHSSRTEAQLLVTLDMGGAAAAAIECGAAQSGSGEIQAARALLQCRLASHLLTAYRDHLNDRAVKLRSSGEEEAAAQLEAEAAATAEPPVERFLPPYPEGVAEVPPAQLPPRPEAPNSASRGRSPTILRDRQARPESPAVLRADLAAAQQPGMQMTAATGGQQLPAPSTGGIAAAAL
jgi:hypothetical protein